jgi:hypothetical protein
MRWLDWWYKKAEPQHSARKRRHKAAGGSISIWARPLRWATPSPTRHDVSCINIADPSCLTSVNTPEPSSNDAAAQYVDQLWLACK